MFLDERIQAQVREMLAPIQKPVEMVVFTTSGIALPGQEVGLQEEALGLLREVAALNPNLSVEQRSIHSDPEAQALGLSYAPTILLREKGSERNNIRFLGLPAGYEFSTLLEALLMLGTGESRLGEKSLAELQKVTSPVRMQAFVTPTCPYCPQAVLATYKLAYHNPNIVAEGVEANEFPALSRRYNISGVPDTIITGAVQQRVLGGQPDRVFVEAAVKASGGVVA
ncbi:MAG: thioredoxin family protein [Meiothermus sp.]|uniref:protein disulfide oxidoreductase n=1 Tax=Meiothermus sp. TaxID=1955249 RepID=UPI0025F0E6A0|nr:thioredoxin family protein [Meiothermus sp.]MCS7058832.1 thioredoxin family protein [Meiothermus sp.]MCS7194068.1 thioredoxin family protein [Meiothermus sp.]MCX7740439.1 thioredoxin family protein [Meiothermus sp.]MDW8091157.1 thioredoxin family protein [Meiothermus sp.]MDW8480467.1 thioredoxin family protein [Meiothermus sp.]